MLPRTFSMFGAAALAVAIFGGVALIAAFVGAFLKPIYIVTIAIVATLFWLALAETGASRLMRAIFALFWGAALLIVADAALAQDAAAAVEPAMTWKDFFAGLWAVVGPYISGPAVVAFLMAQARAWVPALGKLGIFTVIGDIVAGNYRHAANAPK